MISKKTRGFTLLELVIVVVILAITATFVVPNITAIFGLGMKGACVQMGTMIRYTYNQAVIKNKVFRIVYDLENGTYWIEYGEPIEEEKDKKDSDTTEKTTKKEENNEEDEKESRIAIRANFSPFEDESNTFGKESLPIGISFHGVYTEHSGKVVKEGKEFSLFFPNGFTEKTMVYLQDRNEKIYTLNVNPVIGSVEIVEDYVDPENKDNT